MGPFEGNHEGRWVGTFEGNHEGRWVGTFVGCFEGSGVGTFVGIIVGDFDTLRYEVGAHDGQGGQLDIGDGVGGGVVGEELQLG